MFKEYIKKKYNKFEYKKKLGEKYKPFSYIQQTQIKRIKLSF